MPSKDLGTVTAGLESRNMDGLGEYLVRQTALQITSDQGKKLDFEFTPAEERPLSVFAFETGKRRSRNRSNSRSAKP